MTDFQDPSKFMAKINPLTGRPWADDILNKGVPDKVNGSLNQGARQSGIAKQNPDFNIEGFNADDSCVY